MCRAIPLLRLSPTPQSHRLNDSRGSRILSESLLTRATGAPSEPGKRRGGKPAGEYGTPVGGVFGPWHVMKLKESKQKPLDIVSSRLGLKVVDGLR